MAAAHYPGGLRPHPPGRCPGPRPSSEMPPEVTAGTPSTRHLLAGQGLHRRDPDAVAEAIRRAVRSAIVERWGKKPMCHVHVLAV